MLNAYNHAFWLTVQVPFGAVLVLSGAYLWALAIEDLYAGEELFDGRNIILSPFAKILVGTSVTTIGLGTLILSLIFLGVIHYS